MVKPILNMPYAPSHATDVRQAFELERRRLAATRADRLNAAFGTALGLALAYLARDSHQGARWAAQERPA